MLLTLAALLVIAGSVLLFNVGGAATVVIRRLTSRSLGQLQAGYAATNRGVRVYAVLLVAIGVATGGFGIASARPITGLVAILLGVVVFAGASVIAILGEIRTYRALKAGGRGQTAI